MWNEEVGDGEREPKPNQRWWESGDGEEEARMRAWKKDLTNRRTVGLIVIALLNAVVWYYISKALELPYDLFIPLLCGFTLALSLIAFDRNIRLRESFIVGVVSLEMLLFFPQGYEIFNYDIAFVLLYSLLIAAPGIITLMLTQLVYLVITGKATKAQRAGIIGGAITVFFWLIVRNDSLQKFLPVYSIFFQYAAMILPVGILLVLWKASYKERAIGGLITGAFSTFFWAYYDIYSRFDSYLIGYRNETFRSEWIYKIGREPIFILIGVIFYALVTLLGVLIIMILLKTIAFASGRRNGVQS